MQHPHIQDVGTPPFAHILENSFRFGGIYNPKPWPDDPPSPTSFSPAHVPPSPSLQPSLRKGAGNAASLGVADPTSYIDWAAIATRQRELENQIAEQKVLMSRLTTAQSPEETREVLDRIRSIQDGSSRGPTSAPNPAIRYSQVPKKVLKNKLKELRQEVRSQ